MGFGVYVSSIPSNFIVVSLDFMIGFIKYTGSDESDPPPPKAFKI